MAYDDYLLERLALSFKLRRVVYTIRKMMGGILFMVDEKMCIGLTRDKQSGEDLLIVRVGEEGQKVCLERAGCRPMDFTGRPLKGFVFVHPEGFDLEEDWGFWVGKALEYNPKAKKSKK